MQDGKKVKWVALRPTTWERDAKKNRPPILNSDSNPVKPAAIAATAAPCEASSAVKGTSGRPIRLPPKISCNMGEAIPITPIPADTLRHSTAQISQNCLVLCPSFRCTCLATIIDLAACGVQPCGAHPGAGSR